MNRIWNFLAMDAEKRRLFLKSYCVMWGVRCALRLMPFHRLLKRIESSKGAASPVSTDFAAVRRIVWAVEKAGDSMKATCLERALTGQVIMGRAGHTGLLRIGVKPPDGGKLLAHAWVEYRGRVVIGGTAENLKEYTTLPGAGAKP